MVDKRTRVDSKNNSNESNSPSALSYNQDGEWMTTLEQKKKQAKDAAEPIHTGRAITVNATTTGEIKEQTAGLSTKKDKESSAVTDQTDEDDSSTEKGKDPIQMNVLNEEVKVVAPHTFVNSDPVETNKNTELEEEANNQCTSHPVGKVDTTFNHPNIPSTVVCRESAARCLELLPMESEMSEHEPTNNSANSGLVQTSGETPVKIDAPKILDNECNKTLPKRGESAVPSVKEEEPLEPTITPDLESITKASSGDEEGEKSSNSKEVTYLPTEREVDKKEKPEEIKKKESKDSKCSSSEGEEVQKAEEMNKKQEQNEQSASKENKVAELRQITEEKEKTKEREKMNASKRKVEKAASKDERVAELQKQLQEAKEKNKKKKNASKAEEKDKRIAELRKQKAELEEKKAEREAAERKRQAKIKEKREQAFKEMFQENDESWSELNQIIAKMQEENDAQLVEVFSLIRPFIETYCPEMTQIVLEKVISGVKHKQSGQLARAYGIILSAMIKEEFSNTRLLMLQIILQHEWMLLHFILNPQNSTILGQILAYALNDSAILSVIEGKLHKCLENKDSYQYCLDCIALWLESDLIDNNTRIVTPDIKLDVLINLAELASRLGVHITFDNITPALLQFKKQLFSLLHRVDWCAPKKNTESFIHQHTVAIVSQPSLFKYAADLFQAIPVTVTPLPLVENNVPEEQSTASAENTPSNTPSSASTENTRDDATIPPVDSALDNIALIESNHGDDTPSSSPPLSVLVNNNPADHQHPPHPVNQSVSPAEKLAEPQLESQQKETPGTTSSSKPNILPSTSTNVGSDEEGGDQKATSGDALVIVDEKAKELPSSSEADTSNIEADTSDTELDSANSTPEPKKGDAPSLDDTTNSHQHKTSDNEPQSYEAENNNVSKSEDKTNLSETQQLASDDGVVSESQPQLAAEQDVNTLDSSRAQLIVPMFQVLIGAIKVLQKYKNEAKDQSDALIEPIFKDQENAALLQTLVNIIFSSHTKTTFLFRNLALQSIFQLFDVLPSSRTVIAEKSFRLPALPNTGDIYSAQMFIFLIKHFSPDVEKHYPPTVPTVTAEPSTTKSSTTESSTTESSAEQSTAESSTDTQSDAKPPVFNNPDDDLRAWGRKLMS